MGQLTLLPAGVAGIAGIATSLLWPRVTKWLEAPVVGTKSERERAISALWCVHNKRYDMARFVEHHPGGRAPIMLGRGRDCTILFESYHSLSGGRAHAALVPFAVAGALEKALPGDSDHDDGRAFSWESTPFYDALRSRVAAALEKSASRSARCGALTAKGGATRLKVAQLALGCALTALCLAGCARGTGWPRVVATLLLPFAHWAGPSCLMHDCGHFSLLPRRLAWLHTPFAYLGSFHCSPLTWSLQVGSERWCGRNSFAYGRSLTARAVSEDACTRTCLLSGRN